MKDQVKHIINNIFPISEKSYTEIDQLLEFATYQKGETFITKNEQNKKHYFLLNGICKSYLINPEEEEITISFFLENSILWPHTNRATNYISSYFFKSLTDVELASIEASKFEELMVQNLEIRHFGYMVSQLVINSMIEKEIDLATLKAKERLIKFRKKYKGLENLVPLQDIASYLGITNISFSRLRKNSSQ